MVCVMCDGVHCNVVLRCSDAQMLDAQMRSALPLCKVTNSKALSGLGASCASRLSLTHQRPSHTLVTLSQLMSRMASGLDIRLNQEVTNINYSGGSFDT